MSQFHIDFEMDGAKDDIYATECFFLGKKMYYDRLESKDKDGNVITADHIRMRGVPTPCIKYKAHENKCDVINIYTKLYNGSDIEFDLTNNNTKHAFRFNLDKSVSTWKSGEFNRCITANSATEKIEIN